MLLASISFVACEGGITPGAPDSGVDEHESDGAPINLDGGPDIAVGEPDAGDNPDGQAAPDGQAQLPAGVAPHRLVLHPEADAHVQGGSKGGTGLGTAASLWIDQDVSAGEPAQAYLRFRVPKLGSVARALLHLYVSDGSTGAIDVIGISDTGFGETITWNSKPAVDGATLGTVSAPAKESWVELDVTSRVAPDSVFAFALVPRSADGVGIASREAKTHRPKLIIEPGAELPPNAIAPEVDTYVQSGASAGKSFGAVSYMDVDGDDAGSVKQAFLRFAIGAAPPIQRAVLRLYLLDGSTASAQLVAITDHTFADTITWNTKPSTSGGTALAEIGASERGWIELDVTGAVKPGSKLSLALLPASANGIRIATTERAFYRPQLVLTTSKASCGDARCDAGETCKSCAADCGQCPAGCLSGELLPMRGDHHDHTSISDGEGTPADAFKSAKTHKLDYLIITDHVAKITAGEWSTCNAAAKAADAPGSFLAACGWENWIGPGLGHANVLFSSSLTAVPNAASYASWYSDLAACSGCIGQINHPASDRFPWVSFALNTKAASNLALYELNGGGTLAEKITKYAAALDAGWRLAPVWNSDTHSANWGAGAVRSGFWVPARDRASLIAAMRERRSFAASDRDAALWVHAGPYWPGSSVGSASIEPVMVLATDPNDGFDRIVLVGPGGKTLKIVPCAGELVCAGSMLLQVTKATYVFAYAIQKDGGTLVAAPVHFTP